DSDDIPVVDESRFLIRRSPEPDLQNIDRRHESNTTAATPIGADLSTCDDCLREIRDPSDRRFQYPFTNCTNCGPRFTIIQSAPYDRARTTMKSFAMCPRCQSEYSNSSDRRFHAQPNACPECGPQIWFAWSDDEVVNPSSPASQSHSTSLGIKSFASAINEGRIVAIKGIGGFHLACDARNIETVQRLRHRKGRFDKPLAVMVSDTSQAIAFAKIGDVERRILESAERPIVLVPKRHGSDFDDMLHAVAPGNANIGIMLPYSPLHHLLMETTSPLVMTSGNVSDEPIARTNSEARERLIGIADGFLLHDRSIQVVCDDSVVRPAGKSLIPIRRSRGFAPIPIKLSTAGPSVLGIGGEIKSTFCITQGQYAYVSQHFGDIGNFATLETFKENIAHFQKLFRVQLDAVAADLHPDYMSSQLAKQLAQSLDLPLIRVQHHHAHAASLLAEHALYTNQPIIACCFDGTGYGTDGSIWGSEFMIADLHRFNRIAHLNPFAMPGGDAGIRRPYRIALALLQRAGLDWIDEYPCVAACPHAERQLLQRQFEQFHYSVAPGSEVLGSEVLGDEVLGGEVLGSAMPGSPFSSSMGRLFDGVASIIGIRQKTNYEAQSAIELESIAAPSIDRVDPNEYAFDFSDGQPTLIHYSGLIHAICRDLRRGTDRGWIAAKFHHAIANMIARTCANARLCHGIETIGLTGGVFQNASLLTLATRRLQEQGFNVLTHSIVPPNDGSIALGQALIAQRKVRST
ncbi:MAG: carbamoyltransferase HypF, partial [Planctomycetales bacterium]|nr:carbamoyltransferase HypF [Planctomycetales bacterium]